MDTTILPSQDEKKPPSLLERLFITRNYAYNWVGLTFSRLGSAIFGTSLLLWVATTLARNAPWAAFALGGLIFIPTIISFVVNTFAGVYVDRWDPRRVQLLTDASLTILYILFLFATGIVPLPFPVASDAANLFQLACVYVAMIISATLGPFSGSALNVLLYDLVGEQDIERTFGRAQILTNIARILGPPLGAIIFFTLGIQWAIILNALSFAISFFAFYMVRIPRKTAPAATEQVGAPDGEAAAAPAQKSRFLREFMEGLRFVVGNRLIVAILIAIMFITAGAAGIQVFDLYFATNNLHAPPQLFAYMDAIIGVGTILGAVFYGPWLRPRVGMVRAYWMCVLTNGLLFLLFSRLTNIVAAFAVLFLFGISQAVSSIGFGAILFRATPRGKMGRVSSILDQLLTTVSLLSIVLVPFLIAGPLRNKFVHIAGQLFGPIDTIYTVVAVLIITSALYLRVTLNDYAQALNRPPAWVLQQQSGEDPQEPPEPLQPRPQQGRLSTLQKQVAIMVAGLAVVALVILPLALSSPTFTTSSLVLSHGHPAHSQLVDGISCQPSLGTAARANVRLTVYINGQQAGIPAGIGSVAPSQPGVAALASDGQTTCLYALHVFEADNIIHVDSPVNRNYTLGEFFDIWGQPLSRRQVADYAAAPDHALTFYIFDPSGNQQTYNSDPRSIPLVEHETIVILYNSPRAHPIPYTAWNGL